MAANPVQASATPEPSATPKMILSRRQNEVLKLIVQGLTNKEIAAVLSLAEDTVKVHVAALFSKLATQSVGTLAHSK